MLAIATTESALRIDAISLNRPEQAARRSGYTHHRVEIMRQPHDLSEALHWMNWFAQRRYTVSVGLMQINIENAPRYGLRPEQLFDPCTNVAVGADLMARSYHNALKLHGPGRDPAMDAISAYNSGSYLSGYANGYVGTVMGNRKRASKTN
jgi:type IV secretion system protein VirB1